MYMQFIKYNSQINTLESHLMTSVCLISSPTQPLILC